MLRFFLTNKKFRNIFFLFLFIIFCSQGLSGGIVGNNVFSVKKCTNSGNIQASNLAGEICGASRNNIEECINEANIVSNGGNINQDAQTGGIVGIAHYNPTIKSSYNTGTVTGNANVGQIMGLNVTDETNQQTVTIESCYYLGTTTSEQQRTEADMKTTDFINLIGGTTYWKLDSSNKNDGFVILQWQ